MKALLVVVVLTINLIAFTSPAAQAEPIPTEGSALFELHCAACHPHGGNIIRRGRTLKLAALRRRDLASPDAIAEIARNGIGQMGGYERELGESGDREVAEWIWQQAQNAWIQG